MPVSEFELSMFLNGVVLPPLPPYPRGSIEKINAFGNDYPDFGIPAPERVEQTQFGTPQVMPLKWKITGTKEWWLLPVEPLVTVNGKNILAKRNVAKGSLRGTIKVWWMQDDYSISIQGLFTVKDSYQYPAADIRKLRDLCEAKNTIDVLCPAFEELNIKRIVIESYDIPHTKGEENQNWVVNALSDDDWSLLMDRDNTNKDVL